jgi:hypothetical protein
LPRDPRILNLPEDFSPAAASLTASSILIDVPHISLEISAGQLQRLLPRQRPPALDHAGINSQYPDIIKTQWPVDRLVPR